MAEEVSATPSDGQACLKMLLPPPLPLPPSPHTTHRAWGAFLPKACPRITRGLIPICSSSDDGRGQESAVQVRRGRERSGSRGGRSLYSQSKAHEALDFSCRKFSMRGWLSPWVFTQKVAKRQEGGQGGLPAGALDALLESCHVHANTVRIKSPKGAHNTGVGYIHTPVDG